MKLGKSIYYNSLLPTPTYSVNLLNININLKIPIQESYTSTIPNYVVCWHQVLCTNILEDYNIQSLSLNCRQYQCGAECLTWTHIWRQLLEKIPIEFNHHLKTFLLHHKLQLQVNFSSLHATLVRWCKSSKLFRIRN